MELRTWLVGEGTSANLALERFFFRRSADDRVGFYLIQGQGLATNRALDSAGVSV